LKPLILKLTIAVCAIALIGSLWYIYQIKIGKPLENEKSYTEVREDYDEGKVEFAKIEDIQNDDSSQASSDTIGAVDVEVAVKEDSSQKEGTTSAVKLNYSKNMIGWMKVADTSINYPLMFKKNDNNYYLWHNCYDYYDGNGSIFLDGNARSTNQNLNFYGHNIESYYNGMLKDITKFESQSFMNAHRTVMIDLGDENTQWDVVACIIVNLNDKNHINFTKKEFYDENEFKDYVKTLKTHAVAKTDVEVNGNDRLATFATCSYHTNNGRTVLICRQKGGMKGE